MPWVKFTGPSPADIDIPDDLAHRSVGGDTLMLIPGSSYELTNDEWNFLLKQHPGLIGLFQRLG